MLIILEINTVSGKTHILKWWYFTTEIQIKVVALTTDPAISEVAFDRIISFEIIHKNTNQNLLFWFFGFLSLAELFFEH